METVLSRCRRLLALALLLMPAPGVNAEPPKQGEKGTEMPATLYRLILPVGDIDKAASFYGAVLGSDGERVSPGRHYVDVGGVILALYDPAADGDDLGGGWRPHENQYIYIAVPDLEATRSRSEAAGAANVSTIETMPWGERLFYAQDPFGNPISFVDDKTLFTGTEG